MEKVQGGLTEAEKRENVIRLVFEGDLERFEEFVRMVREEIPERTGVVLRGSAVTGQRWNDGAEAGTRQAVCRHRYRGARSGQR